MPLSNKYPTSVLILILLHITLGLGGIFGGAALIIDPSGDLTKLPLSVFEGTIFTNYLIPGIILLFIQAITLLPSVQKYFEVKLVD